MVGFHRNFVDVVADREVISCRAGVLNHNCNQNSIEVNGCTAQSLLELASPSSCEGRQLQRIYARSMIHTVRDEITRKHPIGGIFIHYTLPKPMG